MYDLFLVLCLFFNGIPLVPGRLFGQNEQSDHFKSASLMIITSGGLRMFFDTSTQKVLIHP